MNEIVSQIVTFLHEKKAQNITALDVAGMTVITDCMVIATGRSMLQVKTMADQLEDHMSQMGINPRRKEGNQEGRWVILDYCTALVHLFHIEERAFYNLEKLWDNGSNMLPMPFAEDGDEM